MSTFLVEVLPITIEPHPNADLLECAVVGPKETGFRTIVRKGQYQTGDFVAYIPEGALVPQSLLQEMGLQGKLAGRDKNRVKAIYLRQQLSQGLVYSPKEGWPKEFQGEDVAEKLGITKYIPDIPTKFRGVRDTAPDFMLSCDAENYKKWSNLLDEGEEVYITEKLHGTFMTCAYDGTNFFVSSKGILKGGCILKESNENIYWSTFNESPGIQQALIRIYNDSGKQPVQFVGELTGVQDLKYGQPGEHKFFLFDICVNRDWYHPQRFVETCAKYELPTVPLLYQGPYSHEVVQQHTDGSETVTGRSIHIREGIVIKPARARLVSFKGHYTRLTLKSVSDAYLLRSNTDATEFE